MKRTAMRRVSKKRSLELRQYEKLKTEALPWAYCEWPNGCHKPADQVHHIRGRAGKLLNDKRYWSLLCMDHHRAVHDHPADARKLGLLQ